MKPSRCATRGKPGSRIAPAILETTASFEGAGRGTRLDIGERRGVGSERAKIGRLEAHLCPST